MVRHKSHARKNNNKNATTSSSGQINNYTLKCLLLYLQQNANNIYNEMRNFLEIPEIQICFGFLKLN
jgi:hypothetical protein